MRLFPASQKLFAARGDVRTDKILVTAALVGVPVEFVAVEGEAATAAAAHTGFHKLPVLETSEGAIPFSNTILRYLASAREDVGLKGFSAFDEAKIEEWLEFATRELEPKIALLHGSGPAGFKPEDVKRARDMIQASLPALFAPLERHLVAQTFLVGERLTLADVSVACALTPVLREGLLASPTTAFPALLRWFLTCVHQPEFEAVLGDVVIGDGATATATGGATKDKGAKDKGGKGKEKAAGGAGGGGGGGGGGAAAGGGGVSAASASAASSGRAVAAAALAAASTGGVPPSVEVSATYESFSAMLGASSEPFAAVSESMRRAGASAGALCPSPTLPEARFSRGSRLRVSEFLAGGLELVGRTVSVGGWLRTIRDQKTLMFLDLSDGSAMGKMQILVEQDKIDAAEYAALESCGGVGACILVTGTVVKSPKDEQPTELHATRVQVLGSVNASEYPLSKKRHKLETLREMQHLRPRSNTIGAVTRVRNACAMAIHRFFQERGFLYIHTPIITSSDCEGAGEMFSVTTLMPADPTKDLPRTKEGAIDYAQDFFHRPSSLTVSGQLQVESFACSMCDVYTFGPTFRAENSHTTRHLAEFWMIEPELAFATLEDDMNLAEDFLKFCTQYVLDNCLDEVRFFEENFEKGLEARLRNVVAEPFERLTYTRAIEILTEPANLKKGAFKEKPRWGIDLGSEHERFLTEQIFKKPVILTGYPKEIKAFYMRLNDDERTVRAMDVLVPKIGEVIGGSQREERLDVLERRMHEMGVEPAALEWYLDLRRFGTVPHCGFGLGFERLIMYVTGIENIRDVIPFPRYPGHADV